jgi:hypothetical protein
MTVDRSATMKAKWARAVDQCALPLNVVGACLYVVAASGSWAIPGEHGQVPITGEPFVWFLAVIDIAVPFFLLDMIWGALILRYRRWQSGKLWLWTALTWLIAILIDFAHH